MARSLALRLMSPLCVLCLIWPALWNGYPIVFADTGTYLSQAMHFYLGWDRPIFYSLFIWPLHLGQTTWPVIVAQACVTLLVLDLTRRACGLPRWWLPALIVFLAVATWLPWIVSDLMPDLFTPLLVLTLSLLVFAPIGRWTWERASLTLLAAFMIATQQSSVPLSVALLFVLITIRLVLGWRRARRLPRGDLAAGLAPMLAPCLAIAGLILVNEAAFGAFSISPYGNVFVLARVIYDGPGMEVLRRDCPRRNWRLCPYLDRFPATSDGFLWDQSSPIMLAGGHKTVSADADAIIRAAMRDAPVTMLTATWNNAIEQLTRFDSGDGIENWDTQVGTWIDRDFPTRERAAYHAARQQMGTLAVPPLLAATHRGVGIAGTAAAALLLPIAWRRRHVVAWFLAAALLTLPISAAITGGLSTPHDRYQSRIIWLPVGMAFLAVPALAGAWRRTTRA